MSYPILYESEEKDFSDTGFGLMSDATKCLVTEVRNGLFELEMNYPLGGIHFEDIANRRLLVAKPAENRTEQPFRIYRISKPMKGIVTVYARHISYDLAGIVADPFTAGSAAAAMQVLDSKTTPFNPFRMYTDLGTIAKMNQQVPASVRSLLGGSAGSLLDVYGGEYEFDNMTVKLLKNRGQDNGVTIRYGKNLTDLKQDENCANVRTGIYPYWTGYTDPSKQELVSLPEKVVKAPGTYPFESIQPVDFSADFEGKPTVEQLRQRAQAYVTANKIGVPKVSLKVKFVSLEQTEEYKDLALLERVNLCDTVTVQFPEMGVNATAKVVKTVYNVLLDRMESIELGEARASLAGTIAGQQHDIKKIESETVSPDYISSVASAAAQAIIGAKGGSVRVLDTDADGMLDTLYIADDPDPVKAVKVWRFNYEGWGASKTGYNGPFTMAGTLDQGMVADFITTGQLTANLIKAGVLASLNKNFTLDLETGETTINKGSIKLGAKLQGQFKFTVDNNGYFHAESGEIAGFNITPIAFSSNNIRISQAGDIAFKLGEKDLVTMSALLQGTADGGREKSGVEINISRNCDFLSLTEGNYVRVRYSPFYTEDEDQESLNFYCKTDFHDYIAKRVWIDPNTGGAKGGITGTYYLQDGTAMLFKNGMLVG